MYGVSKTSILNILIESGVDRRAAGETRGGVSKDKHPEICQRYLAGESSYQLGAAYGIDNTTVQKILADSGIDRRTSIEIQGGIPKDQRLEVCRRYLAGESTIQLGKLHGVHYSTVLKVLRAEGVQIRDNSEARGGVPKAKHGEVCRRYLGGESTVKLGNAFGIDAGAIARILEAAGIPRRGRSTPLPDKATILSADLQELIESLGDHIHALPQKSWLAILQHSKTLKAIGDHSALAPIKVRLLEGKITPADIARPEVEPGKEPRPSGLEVELAALVEAAGADAVDEDDTDTEPTQPTEAEPLDITEEPEGQRRALLQLRPEQLISAVSAAARVCPDQELLNQLCRAQVDQLWASVFAADAISQAAAQQVVDQIIATPAVDVWAAKVRDSFLADWRLMEEAGPIPELQMPAGERLNLMQRREAALLLRDRARLNISGMGAGKTRSAICGAQLSGRNRVLVLCPNNTISTWQNELGKCLPTAAVAAKTWAPEWQSDDTPRWLLNNHEMLGDAGAAGLAAALREFCPDAVVIDELHQCKVRDQATESQRHRNLTGLAKWAHTNGAMFYGMSGTPLVNDLGEVIDLIRMVNPELAEGLRTQRTIENCRLAHEALQPISSRFVPAPPAELRNQEIAVRADHLLDEVLDACERGMTTTDAVIAPAKFSALLELAKQDGKLLVFSSAVTGVMAEAKALLARNGIKAVIHSGEDKLTDNGQASVSAFQCDPSVKVLIASTSTLATGFDGLQKVCNRIAFLTLPWTAADYEQAVARLLRQGITAGHVDCTVLVASLLDPETDEDWSLDRQKLKRLTTKRSMAAAVCDGVIPEKAALICTEEKVKQAHRAWARRVREATRQPADLVAA
jgi:superfamily II DNA or RNA helicase